MRKAWMSVAALVVSSWVAPAVAADPPPVPYPAGYRQWAHVKSMVIQPGHPLHQAFGGIHHLYANKAALAGYAKGRFADGSVIVFDLLDVQTEGNAIQEGPRKVVGVMVKNTKRYAATGGWGYEGFKGDSVSERAVGANAASACHQCHTAQQGKGYVFSALRK